MDFIYQEISKLLASNEFLQGGAILGALTWLGYQVKAVPLFVWTKLRYYATYTVHFDQTSDFYRVFSQWLNENYPQKFRNVEIRFDRDISSDNNNSAQTLPVSLPEIQKDNDVKIEKRQYTDTNVIFYKNRWLYIGKDRKEVNTTAGLWSLFFNSYSVSGLFAKKAIESLCQEIADRRNAERQLRDDSVAIATNDNYYFQTGHRQRVKSLEHIFFADKTTLLQDLNNFVEQREFYYNKCLKFKRAYLFYGRGGTGKTSVALGIAKYLNYDVYSINLASIPNNGALQSLSRNVPPKSLILIEDIDTILHKRKVKSDELNFGTVLNFLDGIYSPNDCVIVMTTNKPETLDDALTRKGRVDLALHIDYPNVLAIEEFMSDFYDTTVALPLVTGQAPVGMSAIQDICLQNDLETAKHMVANLFITKNGHKPSVVLVI